ncbi:hypothetical protein X801_08595 [Opisthorchis viverrini]|uniref:Uncharacterized protein n=1 Tax=Opisthorchis viverrini TaxID=6198 RepID=A0A1S8WM94_OPIVI|nr:hypothetical protein X801_08595 [Opisthorchis viverrini]
MALDINRIRNLRTNHVICIAYVTKYPIKNLEILNGFETLSFTLQYQTGYRLTGMKHVRRIIRYREYATWLDARKTIQPISTPL